MSFQRKANGELVEEMMVTGSSVAEDSKTEANAVANVLTFSAAAGSLWQLQ